MVGMVPNQEAAMIVMVIFMVLLLVVCIPASIKTGVYKSHNF